MHCTFRQEIVAQRFVSGREYVATYSLSRSENGQMMNNRTHRPLALQAHLLGRGAVGVYTMATVFPSSAPHRWRFRRALPVAIGIYPAADCLLLPLRRQ